jgi:hypothetical protein
MTKALLVDLNNFGRYPTLAIGYLVASLRAADYDVEVLSPPPTACRRSSASGVKARSTSSSARCTSPRIR